MRLSEIKNELTQRDVLFEKNQSRTELSILLQKNLDAKRNAGCLKEIFEVYLNLLLVTIRNEGLIS